MRSMLVAGTAVAALSLLLGCGGGGGDGGSAKKYEMHLVESDAGGFSVKVPFWNDQIGWHPNVNATGSVTVTNGGGDIDCAGEVNELGENADLAAYIAADLKERKKNKGFKMKKAPFKTKVGGKSGQQVVYEMKSHIWSSESDPYQVEVVTYVLKGRKVYSLRTSCMRAKWDKRKNYFREMHKSFKVN